MGKLLFKFMTRLKVALTALGNTCCQRLEGRQLVVSCLVPMLVGLYSSTSRALFLEI